MKHTTDEKKRVEMRKSVSLKLYIITVAGLAAVIVALLGYGTWRAFANAPQAVVNAVSLSYGDDFSKVPLRDARGEPANFSTQRERAALVLYLSDGCKKCQDNMEAYSRLYRLLDGRMDCAFLYESALPKDRLKQYDIPLEACFVMQENTRLSAVTPTCLIIDKENKVRFLNIDLSVVMQKLIQDEYVDVSQLAAGATAYIKSHYLNPQSEKPQLVYFAMQGCQDCEAADAVLNASGRLKDTFDITRIYTASCTLDDAVKDVGDIFRHAYGIAWYPSFLVLTGEKETLIGETSPGELEQALLACIM